MKIPALSIVIPVFNEEGNLAALDREIKEAVSRITTNFETIYVNDGSTDGSYAELKSLHRIKIINLSRRYGQATAMDAGFRAALGSIIVSMDGDGQNDPSDIPALINTLKTGNFDVVAGWRKNRKDTAGIRFVTGIGRFFRRTLWSDPIHDAGCTLRAYRREALGQLHLSGEMHRNILFLLRQKGFLIGEKTVNHRPRKKGTSKYSPRKAGRVSIDFVYLWFIHRYRYRPIHIFGWVAALCGIGGVVSFVFVLKDLFDKKSFFAALLSSFSLFVCMFIFFSIGLILDILIRIYFEKFSQAENYAKSYEIRDVEDIV